MIRFGVIGFGYWGPNVVRNLRETPGARVVAVSDRQEVRQAEARARYPDIEVFGEAQALLETPQIDAVVIAAPLRTHNDIATRCLAAGKHMLIEKPMCASAAEALRLTQEASHRGLTIMVGHTYCYTGAVRKIKALIDDSHLGEQLYSYDSVRANLGRFQSDVNVISDLAVHDIAILDHLLGRMPSAVTATGARNIAGATENLAHLTLNYADGFTAHIHVSWLAPEKIRRTVVCGSRRLLVYDDMAPVEKLRIHDTRVEMRASTDPAEEQGCVADYHVGEVVTPHLDPAEALGVELRHFVDCIAEKKRPLTDGYSGVRVMQVIEAAQIALREQRTVSLNEGLSERAVSLETRLPDIPIICR